MTLEGLHIWEVIGVPSNQGSGHNVRCDGMRYKGLGQVWSELISLACGVLRDDEGINLKEWRRGLTSGDGLWQQPAQWYPSAWSLRITTASGKDPLHWVWLNIPEQSSQIMIELGWNWPNDISSSQTICPWVRWYDLKENKPCQVMCITLPIRTLDVLLVNIKNTFSDPDQERQHACGFMHSRWQQAWWLRNTQLNLRCWLEGQVYCITPALDGYISLLDRTPHIWIMTSLNICGTVFYDLWHPHPCLPMFYILSNHFASVWIASIWADHSWTQITLADFQEDWLWSTVSQPQPNL